MDNSRCTGRGAGMVSGRLRACAITSATAATITTTDMIATTGRCGDSTTIINFPMGIIRQGQSRASKIRDHRVGGLLGARMRGVRGGPYSRGANVGRVFTSGVVET